MGIDGRGVLSRLAAGWNDFWFRPETPTSLGACRFLFFIGLFAFYGLDMGPGDTDMDIAFRLGLRESFHFPVGLLKFLPEASPTTAHGLYIVLRVAILLSAVGLMTRLSTVVAFALHAYLMSLVNMYGKMLFPSAVGVIMLGILAASSAGDSLSLDAAIRKRWARWPFGKAEPPARSSAYRWPVQLVRVYIVMVFFFAGLSKLRYGGLEWIFSDNLANLIVSYPQGQGCRYAFPLSPELNMWIATHSTVARLMAASVIVVELGSPLALRSGWVRYVAVAAFVGVGVGFLWLLGMVFFEHELGYLVFFLPWGRLVERIARRARREQRKTDDVTVTMSSSRRRLFAVFFAVFLLAHVYTLTSGNHHWPIVSYPMWATLYKKDFECLVAYGVPEDPAQNEIRLGTPQTGFPSFNMRIAFGKILHYPWRNASYRRFAASCPSSSLEEEHACATQHMASDALQHLYERYHAMRGEDDEQPRIRGARLYNVHYTTVAPGKFEVASKELKAEWMRTVPAAAETRDDRASPASPH
jgi:hypothetical protein